MDCPKCIGRLQKKEVLMCQTSEIKELQGAALSQVLEIDQCFACGGVWFDKGELDKYLSEKITTIDSPSLGKAIDQELNIKDGKCPRCQEVLKKEPYKNEPTIILDMCGKCGGFWLDSTEIDRIERTNKEKLGFLALFIKGFKKTT